MSGGGGKPRGGKMGTSIKDSISREVLSSAEHELEMLENKLRDLHQSVNEARRRYQAAEAGCTRIELELDKCNKEVPFPCLSFLPTVLWCLCIQLLQIWPFFHFLFSYKKQAIILL